MKKTLIVSLLGISGSWMANSSHAQPPGPPPGPPPEVIARMIEQLDANEDGLLEIDEIVNKFRDRVAQADGNSDGKLDNDEVAMVMHGIRELMGVRPGGGPPGFGRPGGPDGEGRGPGPDRRGPGGPGGPGRRPGTPPGGPDGPGRGPDGERFLMLFERLDEDGDGKVSVDDLPDPVRDRLSKADTNQDGLIDKQEFKEAHKKMMEMRGSRPEGRGPGDTQERPRKRPGADKAKRERPEDGDNRPQRPKRPKNEEQEDTEVN